jgi:hypothetical protein
MTRILYRTRCMALFSPRRTRSRRNQYPFRQRALSIPVEQDGVGTSTAVHTDASRFIIVRVESIVCLVRLTTTECLSVAPRLVLGGATKCTESVTVHLSRSKIMTGRTMFTYSKFNRRKVTNYRDGVPHKTRVRRRRVF